MTVWQVVESAASRHAARVAIEIHRNGGVDLWTYRDLAVHSLDRAHVLQAAGVEPGHPCALLADHDAHWCAAYLGILAAGGVAVPLDITMASAQLAALVREVRPRVLLVGDRLASVARAVVAGCPGVRLVPLSAPAVVGPTPPQAHRGPAETAVILFTPGTTSAPKGVRLSHQNLLAACGASSPIIAMSEHDIVLAARPFCDAFAHLTGLLLPLSAGARIVLPETNRIENILPALSQRRITVVPCDPHLLDVIHDAILDTVAQGSVVSRLLFRLLRALNGRLRRLGINGGRLFFHRLHAMLGPVRLFIAGGARFSPEGACDLYRVGFTVLKHYGLAETAGTAALTRHDDACSDTVGHPVAGHEIRLVPSHVSQQDCEIAVRGPAVMQGYLNRPEETAAVLRDGWLYTGDLGKLDNGGRLFVTGRQDDLVVLPSGEAVNAERIERQYLQSPFVKDVCVTGVAAIDDDPASLRLHAVVVPDVALLRKRQIANAGDLLRFELEGQSIHLPPQHRVAVYDVSFDPLPRTARGRLKRHEVQRRVAARRFTAASAPENETLGWGDDADVRRGVAVIRRYAGRRRIEHASNLEIDLGIDSVGRVELIAALEAEFGVRLSSERVHELLTAGQMIDAIRAGGTRRRGDAAAASWRTQLRELPPAHDPVVRPILAPRVFTPWMIFTAFRAARLFLPRFHVQGMEHLPGSGPYILAPNHQSYLDPLLVCSVLPYRVFRQLFVVGATEYFETPLAAWAARQLNVVPVDPDANLTLAMRSAAFGLSHGKILLLFPEGERSVDGTVKRFKKGAALLAHHLDIPVVPVAIHGAFDLWPRNRAFGWRLLLPWSRHVVRLSIGRPLAIATSDSREGADLIQSQVTAMWQALADRNAEQESRSARDGSERQT